MVKDFMEYLLSRDVLPVAVSVLGGLVAIISSVIGMKTSIKHQKEMEGVSNLTIEYLDGTKFEIDLSREELSEKDKNILLEALSSKSKYNLKIGEIILQPPQLEGGSIEVEYSNEELSGLNKKVGENHE